MYAFNEWYRNGMDELGKEIDRIERKASIREQLEGIIEFLPMSYIAKHYFGKSASWLYQRINGNTVRGRVYTLNDEQRATFNAAKRTKKSPKAHTKTDTSSQEKLFGEIQNSFLYFSSVFLCTFLYNLCSIRHLQKCTFSYRAEYKNQISWQHSN